MLPTSTEKQLDPHTHHARAKCTRHCKCHEVGPEEHLAGRWLLGESCNICKAAPPAVCPKDSFPTSPWALHVTCNTQGLTQAFFPLRPPSAVGREPQARNSVGKVAGREAGGEMDSVLGRGVGGEVMGREVGRRGGQEGKQRYQWVGRG